MKTIFSYSHFIIISLLLIGCADSLYWSRLNTVEDIIQHPDKVKQIIDTSQFSCNNDKLLNQESINNISNGKYYYYHEDYGLLQRMQYVRGEYINPSEILIHDIKLRSPIATMPDYSFLFVEKDGKWCLEKIGKAYNFIP